MTTTNDTPVLIAGAGIGGLTLAAALRKHNIAYAVLERTPEFAPIGAGIVLSVNAMRVMRNLSLADELTKRGFALNTMDLADEYGRVLSRTSVRELEPEFGPTVALHRADLHEVLLEAAGADRVTLGSEVTEVSETSQGRVTVRCANGTQHSATLLVGADGVRSRVRQSAFPAIRLWYSGYTSWRAVVDVPSAPDGAVEMWGRGRRFGIVPLGPKRVYCYATTNAPEGAPTLSSAEFRQMFAGFGGMARVVVERITRDDQLFHGDICEARLAVWHKPGAVLIGDAAHAATPNLGQGAAMAIEDAAVLAESLATLGVDNPAALAAWERRRRARVQWVQDQSRRVGAVGQWSNALACTLREWLIRAALASSGNAVARRLASTPI